MIILCDVDTSCQDKKPGIKHINLVDFIKSEKPSTDRLREKNPSSLLLWAHGMMGNDLEPVIRAAMERYSAETGDKNVDYLPLPDTTEANIGAHSHPGFFSHLASARVLAEYLGKRFNAEVQKDILL